MQRILDKLFTSWLRQYGIVILRISLGLVFAWFGLLKIVGASPVVGLVTETYGFLPVPMETFLLALGAVELLIGLCLVFRVALRATIILLWIQMLGTFTAVFLAPAMFYGQNLFFLTMEGEFVVKNLVLVAASLAIGGQEA